MGGVGVHEKKGPNNTSTFMVENGGKLWFLSVPFFRHLSKKVRVVVNLM